MSDFYILQNGQQTGPFTKEELDKGILTGRFVADDWVWTPGTPDWQQCSIKFPSMYAKAKQVPPPPPLAALRSQTPPPTKTNHSSKKNNQPLVLACFVVLGVLFYINRDNANDEGPSSIQQATAQPLTTEAPSPKTEEKIEESPDTATANNSPSHSIGENFQIGDFSYVINSVKKTDHIGISGLDIFNALGSKTEKANMDAIMQAAKQAGIISTDDASSFLVVNYKIKNEGKEASVISTTDFKIIDTKGRTFTTSAKATTELVANESEDYLFSELQPGITKAGIQAFELPKDSFDGRLTLVIPEKGILGSKEVRVEIDLSEESEHAKQEAAEASNQSKRLEYFRAKMENPANSFLKIGQPFALYKGLKGDGYVTFKINAITKTTRANLQKQYKAALDMNEYGFINGLPDTETNKNEPILAIHYHLKCEGRNFDFLNIGSGPEFQLSNLTGEGINGPFVYQSRKTIESPTRWGLDMMLPGEEIKGIKIFKIESRNFDGKLILFVKDNEFTKGAAVYEIN